MALTADFHLHSYFSGDSTEPLEQMVLSAIQKGLTHICMTEHMDMDYPESKETPADTFLLNTDSYLYELANLKEKYSQQIKIFFGVELGMQTHLQKELSLYARAHDFDFIIGSVHVVDREDPYYGRFYEGKTEEDAYRSYFQCILNNIKKFHDFDVCGHLDYVVRYGPNKDTFYSYEKYKDLFDPILTHIIENEKGIELNTGSLRRGTRDVSPCFDVIKRYRELGGEIITVGSDAHFAKDIASDYKRAAEVLQTCGFKYYCVFENRIAEFRRL